MSWRFYRRIRIIPGLRVNLSRSGLSLSIGHRGAWYTLGPRGRRVTLGLPGTGLFWTEHAPPAAPHYDRLLRVEHIPPAAPIHGGHRAAFILAIVAAVAIGVLALAAAHG